MDYAVQNFQQDVIEASKNQLVLVDFWAEWCGPCRLLSPILEKLAEEFSADWKLVKIDTEKFPEPTREYEVQGIPNVKLFVDGKPPIHEFTCALPEHAICLWLKEAIPDKFEKDIIQARELLKQGPRENALSILDSVLAQEAHNENALSTNGGTYAIPKPEPSTGTCRRYYGGLGRI